MEEKLSKAMAELFYFADNPEDLSKLTISQKAAILRNLSLSGNDELDDYKTLFEGRDPLLFQQLIRSNLSQSILITILNLATCGDVSTSSDKGTN